MSAGFDFISWFAMETLRQIGRDRDNYGEAVVCVQDGPDARLSSECAMEGSTRRQKYGFIVPHYRLWMELPRDIVSRKIIPTVIAEVDLYSPDRVS